MDRSTNCTPLDRDTSLAMINLLMLDKEKPSAAKEEDFKSLGISENDVPFPVKVALQRVKAMNLPIEFTLASWFMFGLLPDRVGGVVVMLIDLLEAYEGQLVSVEKIANKYPCGFYTEEALIERIDFLKDPLTTSKFKHIY